MAKKDVLTSGLVTGTATRLASRGQELIHLLGMQMAQNAAEREQVSQAWISALSQNANRGKKTGTTVT